MYKSYSWNTLKRHSAFDVLMRVSGCILFHIEDMQFFRFFSVTATQ